MTKKQYFIYTAIAIIVTWLGIIFIPTLSSPDMGDYDKKLDSLQTVIDNNNIKIHKQEQKDSIFETYIHKIDSQSIVFESKLKKLNKNKDAKIKAVDTLSNDSLYKSITNRYK